MTEQLTTTSILALFETDKAQRKSFVTDLITKIDSGEINPLNIHLQIKCMEDIINSLTSTDEKKNKNVEIAKKYKAALLAEAEKYGKSFIYHDQKIDIRETGVKYDFSKSGDPIWNELNVDLQRISEAMKARETLLKTLPGEGMEIRNDDELITIYPPSKSSTTSIAVTLK